MGHEIPFENPYRIIQRLKAEGGREPIPPFEPGDIVQIIPHRGCSIGAEFCRVPLEVERCVLAPVDPEILWDIDLLNCPYIVLYPLPDGEDYAIVPVKLKRDQEI